MVITINQLIDQSVFVFTKYMSQANTIYKKKYE